MGRIRGPKNSKRRNRPMSKKNRNQSQPPASEQASQQASQPQTTAINGQKQSSDQAVINKQTRETEDKENYYGLVRVTANTPALISRIYSQLIETPTKDTQRLKRHEEEQQKRLHDQLYPKSVILFGQAHKRALLLRDSFLSCETLIKSSKHQN